MTVLITGVAGFIGNHLAHRLLGDGHEIVGIDALTPYYDVGLKHARLKRLEEIGTARLEIIDICDLEKLDAVFSKTKPETVVHLAAQPGIRYSLEAPASYVTSNLEGFGNLLEMCRQNPPEHLIFASSSSVYGANRNLPWSEDHVTAHPLSLYAATKKANEVTAHSYSHLFDLPVTGVRFFTVYGEWGRPDMAFFKFADAILNGRPIDVYNHGKMTRDFTYVGDIAESLVRLLDVPPGRAPQWDAKAPAISTSGVAPYRLLNAGNGNPVALMDCIEILERCLDRKAALNMMDIQPGEVEDTWANVDALAAVTGFRPATSIEDGIAKFADWYKAYFNHA